MKSFALSVLLVAAIPAASNATLVPRTTFAEEMGYIT